MAFVVEKIAMTVSVLISTPVPSPARDSARPSGYR
jgi:hypothetical protein